MLLNNKKQQRAGRSMVHVLYRQMLSNARKRGDIKQVQASAPRGLSTFPRRGATKPSMEFANMVGTSASPALRGPSSEGSGRRTPTSSSSTWRESTVHSANWARLGW